MHSARTAIDWFDGKDAPGIKIQQGVITTLRTFWSFFNHTKVSETQSLSLLRKTLQGDDNSQPAAGNNEGSHSWETRCTPDEKNFPSLRGAEIDSTLHPRPRLKPRISTIFSEHGC
jgi:hypothetical protein